MVRRTTKPSVKPIVSRTVRRVAGSALLAAGLALAGVELFTLAWQMGRPDQYELIARGGDLLVIVLPAILLGAVAITLVTVWRLTRAHQLGLTQRLVLPGLAAALSGYLMTAMLAFWILVPIGLVNLLVREVITWALVGGAVWIGMRLVRDGGQGRAAAA
jgi:hypothetical protein